MIVQKVTKEAIAKINQYRQAKVGTYYVLPDGNTYLGTSNGIAVFKGLALNDSIIPTEVFGDVEGNMPFLYLSAINNGQYAGIWGDATHVPQFTLDTKGRVLSVVNVPISATAGDFNIDGGASDSVYTPNLFIDGGTA